MIKIAINGCGRIGKLLIRRLFDMGLGENLILINEPIGSVSYTHLTLPTKRIV